MKLVILDRDGVINFDSAEYIKSPEEWRPIPGSLEAIAKLTTAGFTVCVATNQAALARGLLDVGTLDRIHDKMRTELGKFGGRIARIYHCPHAPEVNCPCRKPRPGMLLQAASDFEAALDAVPFIGDSRKDIDAAAIAGALPVLVRTGNGFETEAAGQLPSGTRVYDDLANAVAALLRDKSRRMSV